MRDFQDEVRLGHQGLRAIASQKLSDMAEALQAYDSRQGDGATFSALMHSCEAMERVAKIHMSALDEIPAQGSGQSLGAALQDLAARVWGDAQVNLLIEGGRAPEVELQRRAQSLAMYQKQIMGCEYVSEVDITTRLQKQEYQSLSGQYASKISEMQLAAQSEALWSNMPQQGMLRSLRK